MPRKLTYTIPSVDRLIISTKGVLRYVAVGQLYVLGVVVQVAADVGNVACYHSNRPLSHPYLFFLNRNFLPAYSQQQIVEL